MYTFTKITNRNNGIIIEKQKLACISKAIKQEINNIWDDGSFGKVPSSRVRGPEFESTAHVQNSGCHQMCL